MIPIYRCYLQSVAAQAGRPRLLAGITTGPCSGQPGQHQHITSHAEQRSRIRPEPVGARPACSCPAHDCDHGFSDWWYFVLRRWIMSNLVSFTWIIDWKDKRVDLFTHNIDVLGSGCYVLCNSEHWTYFLGTCIRLYFVGILLISYWTHDHNNCPVAAIWNLLLCPKIMFCFRKKSGIITRPININSSYFCLCVCHCRH